VQVRHDKDVEKIEFSKPGMWLVHGEVRMVSLAGMPNATVGLQHIQALNTVTLLSLRNTDLTTDDMCVLGEVRSLRGLVIDNARIDERTLRCIAKIPALETLSMVGTPISDSMLRHLVGHPQLRVVRVGDTDVGDAGVEHIVRIPKLSHLDLSGTKVDDAGVVILADKAPRVPVKNAEAVSEGRGYVFLDLSRTSVTDAGVEALLKNERLDEIRLSLTPTTQAVAVSLEKKFPGVVIKR
jgi:hypothetical protein